MSCLVDFLLLLSLQVICLIWKGGRVSVEDLKFRHPAELQFITELFDIDLLPKKIPTDCQ